MIWVLAAIVVVTIGVMAVIDAYFEGDRAVKHHLLCQYLDGTNGDVEVWYSSYLLYTRSRPKDYEL